MVISRNKDPPILELCTLGMYP